MVYGRLTGVCVQYLCSHPVSVFCSHPVFVVIQVVCQARVANIEIPNNKCIRYSLQYIFGVGDKTAQQILAATNVDPARRTYELSEDDLSSIRDEVEKYVVEGDLRRTVSLNIKRCGRPCCTICEFVVTITGLSGLFVWDEAQQVADWYSGMRSPGGRPTALLCVARSFPVSFGASRVILTYNTCICGGIKG